MSNQKENTVDVSKDDFRNSLPEGLQPANLALPVPSLALDFRMAVSLNPRISVGPTPLGQRNWISFSGGSWVATWGSGTVVPGGQDNQLVLGDLATQIETSYLLQTADETPAYITIKTTGWRTGPREVLEALFDPARANEVDPHTYKFRLTVEMQTGDERYAHVNTSLWVASGMRKGAQVIYDAFLIS